MIAGHVHLDSKSAFLSGLLPITALAANVRLSSNWEEFRYFIRL